MKRIILFTSILIFLLSPTVFSAIGNQGLIINGGVEEIVLKKGEKIRLRVRDRGTNLPVLKDVSFFSDNDLIATVDEESGILRGNSIGRTRIVVMRSNGNGTVIGVRVVRSGKLPPIFIFLLLLGGGGLCFLLRKGCCR